VGGGLRGRDDGSDVNKVQYNYIQNCYYKSPPDNEYILINIYNKKIKACRDK
jgi:hypothetical protein